MRQVLSTLLGEVRCRPLKVALGAKSSMQQTDYSMILDRYLEANHAIDFFVSSGSYVKNPIGQTSSGRKALGSLCLSRAQRLGNADTTS